MRGSAVFVNLFLTWIMLLPFYLFPVAAETANETTRRSGSSSPQKKLLDRLINNYGANSLRPVWNLTETVTVQLRFLPTQLIYFNERQQEVSVTAMMAQRWRDEFITWDEEAEGVEVLSVDLKQLWIPDITLYENVDREFLRFKDIPGLVYSNGSVEWYTPMITTTTCRVRVRYFPFDTQECNITFGSWSHDSSDINLTFQAGEEGSQQVFLQNGVWELARVDKLRYEKDFLCCDHPFSLIVYTLYFQRSSTFYVNTILTPCILLSFMNLLVFWLPPDAGEKISLGMTNLLALILFQQLVAENMPPLGDEFPILGTYFAAMIGIGCIAVTGTVVVLRIFYKGCDGPPPKLFRRLLKKNFVRRSLHRHPGYNTSRRHKVHSRTILDKLEKSIRVHYANGSEVTDLEPQSEVVDGVQGSASQSKASLRPTRDLHSIMSELRKSEERALETEKREMVEQEWKDLAAIVDLVLFFILLLATIFTLIFVLVTYSMYTKESARKLNMTDEV